jgi:hypothetical protein
MCGHAPILVSVTRLKIVTIEAGGHQKFERLNFL